MNELTVREVEYLAFRLAREILTFNEPIPDFSTRFPNKLESCLSIPFMTFSGKNLYPSLVAKGAILFYLMIKNHPFQNGNKRIAMTTLLVFLCNNKKWIRVEARELYEFTMWIAQSPARAKGPTLKAIEEFLRARMVPFSRQSGRPRKRGKDSKQDKL